MKRDWELIRERLQIEALQSGQHVGQHCAEAVGYPIHLMRQANLIECSRHHPGNGASGAIANGLALTGQGRLDGITYEGPNSAPTAAPMRFAANRGADEGHSGHVYNGFRE